MLFVILMSCFVTWFDKRWSLMLTEYRCFTLYMVITFLGCSLYTETSKSFTKQAFEATALSEHFWIDNSCVLWKRLGGESYIFKFILRYNDDLHYSQMKNLRFLNDKSNKNVIINLLWILTNITSINCNLKDFIFIHF